MLAILLPSTAMDPHRGVDTAQVDCRRRGAADAISAKFDVARRVGNSGRAIFRGCGEGEIRTPDTGFSPYNGLANRRLRPLGHLSKVARYYLRSGRISSLETRAGVGNPAKGSETTGGGGGIRTPGACALRFSRPSPSTTRPLLRVCRLAFYTIYSTLAQNKMEAPERARVGRENTRSRPFALRFQPWPR
jgi:hypothetical protein